MLLAVSLGSILVIGILAWQNAQNALEQSIFNQLTSVRASKAYQIEAYFDTIYSQTRTLAENRMVVNAMKNFTVGYREALDQSLSPEQHQELTDYYKQVFLPRLAAHMDEPPLLISYRPQRLTASYFQYHYMVNNALPLGSKDEMITAFEDPTTYNRFHTTYHPPLSNLRREFGFHDIFLIELETGNVVYSVFKETDFATSLREGPYRESGLGILAARIREAPERDEVTIVDYRSYDPSYGAPAAFVGAPIFDQNEVIGILALQLPVDAINNVMTGSENWQQDGLGSSGETYLVGPDHLMRSISRFYLEDPEEYFTSLRSGGISSSTIETIRNHETSILFQPVHTDAAEQAISGESGTRVVRNYRGTPVLSAYAPVEISGLAWNILSEIDVTEAFVPIYNLQKTLLIWGVSLIMLVAFLAILLSNYFVRPIENLIDGVAQIQAGDENVNIEVATDDEFGVLARNFNAAIEEQKADNEKLMLNILPASVAERQRNGEQIAEKFQQVSVIFIHILGFAKLSDEQSALESAHILESLISAIDEVATRYDVERIRTIGTTYIATCGLISARLDHANRSIEFAQDVIRIVERFDHGYAQELAVQVGIDAGPVTSGVIGTERFNFELWGETADIANHIHTLPPPNHILITKAVQQRVEEQFALQRHPPTLYHETELELYEIALDTSDDAANGAVNGAVNGTEQETS